MPTCFDNRNKRARLYYRAMTLLGRRPRNVGESHYVFEFEGKKIAYCYIRKNASTAFKRLILDLSPHRSAIDQCKSRIQFMDLYHRESRIDALESCDYRIFVYRDVLERIASLFVNKFIVRSGAENIMKDISRRLKKSPEDVSFINFVTDYLGRAQNVNDLDPHVWEQIYHLRPVRYTHAIAIKRLEGEMSEILGLEIAHEYFGKKTNSAIIDARTTEEEKDVANLKASELNNYWQRTGLLPKYEHLLRSDLAEKISMVYSRDLKMIKKIQQS